MKAAAVTIAATLDSAGRVRKSPKIHVGQTDQIRSQSTIFVDAAILSSGARVEVVCIRPFFGNPYVTKVTLLSSSHDSKIKRTRARNAACIMLAA
jgi:hypothetical protein